MPLHDLTPQLRTRLSRIERAVGLFVTLATLILLFGFGYYLYKTAYRKGWFLTRAPYFTYVDSAAGLRVGDPIKLMGFDVGEITKITAEDPDKEYDVYIEFNIKSPYYGYIWTDSKVKVTSADLLGNRYLEVVKGGTSGSTNNLHATYREQGNRLTEIWLDKEGAYTNYTKESKPYWLISDETPTVGKRMEMVANLIQTNLPNVFNLTNLLAGLMTNAASAATRLDTFLVEARPAATNLVQITDHLRNTNGALGQWLFSPALLSQLEHVVATTDSTLAHTDTNLTTTLENLGRTLDNLASLTSNLNAQVQVNSNILEHISTAVSHSDELVQGLKKHWFLRSAFKTNRNDKANSRRP